MPLQKLAEEKVGFLIAFILVVISFGLLIEVLPLFASKAVTQPTPGIQPYSPLQLAGRDVYLREGCYGCHSQMIRPLRAETERYGHYSVAGESVYDHPFQWGSKRTGPDLARIGERYSDEWHRLHLLDPRQVVPESNMPAYPHLANTTLDAAQVKRHMQGLEHIGVPYTAQDYEHIESQIAGKTEMDALIAYLQGLGLALKQAR